MGYHPKVTESLSHKFTERVKDQSKFDAIANSWHFPSLLLFVAMFFIPLAKAVQLPANHPTVDLSGSVWDSAFEPTSKTTCQEWFQEAILLFPPGFFPSGLVEEIHNSFTGISALPFHRFPEWLGNSDYSETIGPDIIAQTSANSTYQPLDRQRVGQKGDIPAPMLGRHLTDKFVAFTS
jgi:hypothetical protein